MARYSDLRDELRPDAQEAPNPALDQAARRAVAEFCKRTRIWRETDRATIEAGKDSYEFRPTEGGVPLQYLTAWYFDDDNFRVQLRHNRFQDVRGQRGMHMINRPMRYGEMPDRSGITIFPVVTEPKPGATIEVYMAVLPARNGRSFPDHILQDWKEELVDGALSYLLRMKNRPWSNPELAALHWREFLTGCNNARRAQLQDGGAPTTTKLRKYQ